MNVLEKILEEIEEKIKLAGRMMVEKPCDKLDEIANDTAEAFIGAYEECSEIIRSHMDDGKDANIPTDDGWIPVEERLPESKTHVLCCFENGTVDALWQDWKDSGFGGYFNDDFKPMEVAAWRPLPEPYKPKKLKTEEKPVQ